MNKLTDLINELCPDGVEYQTIDELCSVSAGGDVPKDNFSTNKTEENTIPIISNSVGDNAIYGFTNKAKIEVPSVTIAARGTIGYAEYRDYPYYPIIRLLSITPKNINILDTKYLYYAVYRKKYKVPKSGIPQLTAPKLKKEVIPVPPIEVQEEIVKTLDEFTSTKNNLIGKLKQEIEETEKIYAYCVDKLLNFKAVEK